MVTEYLHFLIYSGRTIAESLVLIGLIIKQVCSPVKSFAVYLKYKGTNLFFLQKLNNSFVNPNDVPM